MSRIKWNSYYSGTLIEESNYIQHSYNVELDQKVVTRQLSRINATVAINEYLSSRISEFKVRMSYSAMTFKFIFDKYENDWPYWNIKPYAYALLSDNLDLIDQLLSIEVHESKTKGNPVYFNDGIKGLLTNNTLLIEKSIDILDYKIMKRKEIRWSRVQKKCVEALASMDEQLLLDALSEFEDARIKKQAIEADICENFISFFPIIYAKIAWMKGMEIDPRSKFMPIELLKIYPLKEYTIPYWFLRDYYREQGINWRYDPLHPKLQDWENDPENPDNDKGGFFKKIFG